MEGMEWISFLRLYNWERTTYRYTCIFVRSNCTLWEKLTQIMKHLLWLTQAVGLHPRHKFCPHYMGPGRNHGHCMCVI